MIIEVDNGDGENDCINIFRNVLVVNFKDNIRILVNVKNNEGIF